MYVPLSLFPQKAFPSDTFISDIRFTTQVIGQLLYLSPTRHLLYVTDTFSPLYNTTGKPSHTFEHLSCFFPGLLALGAHTLPLDNLAELGIDLDELASRSDFGDAKRAYQRLKKYNLKELHMWAAEGIAQSCYLSYRDMPSGLGPDEMLMYTEKDGTVYPWLDALDKWYTSGGRRGPPPGVDDKKPVVYKERDRLLGSGRGRDYALKKTGYLLRPEVRTASSFVFSGLGFRTLEGEDRSVDNGPCFT